MYTAYVKTPKVIEILETEKSCEEKLSELRSLIGLDQNIGKSKESGTISDQTDTHDEIIQDLSENEKKLAKEVLQLIETSKFISYDKQNFQLIINDRHLKFTNIKLLLKRLLEVSDPTQPLGFVSWISALLQIKLPYHFFRSGDSIEVRDQLLALQQQTSNEENDTQPKNEMNSEKKEETISVASSEESKQSEPAEKSEVQRQKRKRKESDAENTDASNVEAVDKKTKKRKRDSVSDEKIQKLRRSPRLQKEISKVWEKLE